MGLDMYLEKHYYIQNWDHNPPEDKFEISITKGGKPFQLQGEPTYIHTEVMYWRKANAIHKWFVDNVQDGKDDCGTYDVAKSQLQELLNLVNKILDASKLVPAQIHNGDTYHNGKLIPNMQEGKTIEDKSTAKRLLPNQEGFFFGSQEYDQYYYEDLVYTSKELTKLLTTPDDGGYYHYHSSW
jgi:hypothetical protein